MWHGGKSASRGRICGQVIAQRHNVTDNAIHLTARSPCGSWPVSAFPLLRLPAGGPTAYRETACPTWLPMARAGVRRGWPFSLTVSRYATGSLLIMQRKTSCVQLWTTISEPSPSLGEQSELTTHYADGHGYDESGKRRRLPTDHGIAIGERNRCSGRTACPQITRTNQMQGAREIKPAGPLDRPAMPAKGEGPGSMPEPLSDRTGREDRPHPLHLRHFCAWSRS